MPNEVVFVGAGPIGLWTAIQMKLRRPGIEIVFKEKKEEYTRTHTLLLYPDAFAGCQKDDTGVIQGIIDELRVNPHIRTNELEARLKALAGQLEVKIDLHKIENVTNDILLEHPGAAMIIGSDGVRSKVDEQIFGQENTERVALAYAAQIKYSVKGEAVRENDIFQLYPRLKQSNYLASINVGRLGVDGRTPVTIQLVIDKQTYDQISHATYARPIRLLADSVDEKIPPELLKDIKSHLGFRLENGEDIIINDINLTASELPQQRRRQVTKLINGQYYGLIGDAALALSYFRGMNTGLKLATEFSQAIVDNWDKVTAIVKDPTTFDDFEKVYDKFATEAFKHGYEKNRSVRKLFSTIQASGGLPFQFLYFDTNTIIDFHRCFDIYNQTCQFYIDAQIAALGQEDGLEAPQVIPGAHDIKTWLEEQWIGGFGFLKDRLLVRATENEHNPRLCRAIKNLAQLDSTKLGFYEKINLGLAFSKVNTLLTAPTPAHYQACVQFADRLKAVGGSFALIMSSLVELIAGLAAITLGIVAMVASAGAAAPYAVPIMAVGGLLTGHGIYKLQKNLRGDSAVCKAIAAVIKEREKLADGPMLKGPVAEVVELEEDVEVEDINEAVIFDDPDVAAFTR